ncbi:hypothetical protein S7711_03361 [Stachybotrys chartarum IBT 7711]|uniref:FeS cluster biogenesis domain-containing protein n=1 Tax=Stachybotrys chartarum (strain CBS 109288 / IBT 7711) TaxID=1280523 RepID=A0A084AUT6_STACB|nr:hypothetical protein S7711_03361 [Stachybotrys chartarum IBT 7711]
MPPLHCTRPASAARSFVHIATRSYSTPLDFLAPRCLRTFQSPCAPIHTATLVRAQPHRPNVTPGRSKLFTTSPSRRATVCVQNPLKDEDGKEMMLEITPRAAKRLSQIMLKDKNPNLALRIQVESGGCHGFQYLMSLITIPGKDAQEGSSVVKEDDSIFQFIPDEGNADPAPEALPKIILDEPSLELLQGSKVDFTMELIGSEFKIVDNPHASSSCGCGTSFDIKM